MIYIKGDMFEVAKAYQAVGIVPVIGHGVNCRGVMGAGVAAIVRERFPEAYTAYIRACRSYRHQTEWWFNNSHRSPVGKAQLVTCTETLDLYSVTIANMFTQVNPGPDARLHHITKAIRSTLDRTIKDSKAAQLMPPPVVIPMIGAGIGGLDRDDVLMELTAFGDRLVVVELPR